MGRREPPEGAGANPRCPACHAPGIAAPTDAAELPLFICGTPDCVVQTFDTEGAQSVRVPTPPRLDDDADGDAR